MVSYNIIADSYRPWMAQLLAHGHINRAAVALANKTARITGLTLTIKRSVRRVKAELSCVSVFAGAS